MASGAVRIAGSLNFKERYQPDFPRVRLTDASPGRIATRSQLESLRLVAPPEIFRTGFSSSFSHALRRQKMAQL
jgi:hypothetical protein